MKRKSIWLTVLIVPLLALFTSCNNKDNEKEPDQVTLADGVTEIVFTPGGGEDQTITFSTTAPWSIKVDKIAFVKFNPSQGTAGTSTVTISLFDPENPIDREATATITAGTASATFRITQIAPPTPEEIRIVASQTKLPIGKTMQLKVEVEPEDAIIPLVQWSSSTPSVLSVDQEGKVTAIAEGSAVVTAVSGNLSAECTLEVTEAFTTDGTGKTYTFKMLSELESSGVEVEGGSYVLTANIIIAENDKLEIGNGEQVKIGDKVELKIIGTADFTPESSATIEPYDAAAIPAPIYFTETGGGTIRNMKLIGAAIRFFGISPLTITKCEFSQIRSKFAAINLGGSGQMTVTECRFIENDYPVISGGANMVTPLIFNDNYLYKNSKNVSNRPQVNVTVAGNDQIVIKNNTVIGPGVITKNGGISVANLLGIAGTNKVLIEGNKVSDCRYGITTNGTMDVRIIGNILENNKWDDNPMNGGSGVSIYNSKGGQKVYMQGNKITGHLWGITNIGDNKSGKGPELNLGNQTQGADYNPGGNIFKDNGNGGKLYDLYNNCPLTVYAQGNTWNVSSQTQPNIEQVIFHKPDDPALGEVIYMPAAK